MRAVAFAALLTLLASGASGAEEPLDYKALSRGLELIGQGKLDAGYDELDRIPPESPLYRYSFLEMQKIHYRRAQWDRFFGYAAYYRDLLLPRYQDVDPLLLESLALTKHCQLDAAERVLARARLLARSREEQERVQGVEDLLFLQSKIPGNVVTRDVRAPIMVFSPVSAWKVPSRHRSLLIENAVRNPRALRVYVKNLCAREGQ